MNEDNTLYYEDALLTWKILSVIKQEHELEIERMYRHVKVMDMEVDAVAVCRTTWQKRRRMIGFELKDSDIQKAILQAYLRRRFFDYFYIILNLRTSTIVSEILKLETHKIGFISSKDDVIVLPSKFQKRVEIPFEGRQIDKNQVKLIKFLHENVGNK